MALYLTQHGKSLPKEQDPEQGLSEAGIEQTRLIAGVARNYNVPVDALVCSTKKRARQTAEIFAEYLTPVKGIETIDGIKPMDDVTLFAQSAKGRNNTMVVSHLPFLSRLLSYLITGSPDTPLFRFQNSGIICVDPVPEETAWIIRWTLMPTIQ